jgi:hypothetical protein
MLGGARVLEANWSQRCWDLVELEALLAAEHRARLPGADSGCPSSEHEGKSECPQASNSHG